MTRLPTDVSRCAGQRPTGICPERESCARYRCSGPRCSPVPLAQWLCDDASFAQRDHALGQVVGLLQQLPELLARAGVPAPGAGKGGRR